MNAMNRLPRNCVFIFRNLHEDLGVEASPQKFIHHFLISIHDSDDSQQNIYLSDLQLKLWVLCCGSGAVASGS